MSIERSAFELKNGSELSIRGDVRSDSDRDDHAAAIVICHGFKGFKDWGYFPYVSEQLAQRTGRPVISFNFSGNGVGADLLNFTELDLFEANTFSAELDDLGIVLDAAASGDLPLLTGSTNRFGLLGHSRGGGIAILKAAEDDRVASLVTWAATASFDRWSEEMKAEWRRTGRFEVLNMRTKQVMPLGLGLLEDFEQHAERLDIQSAASLLNVPFLIIHGTADESVDVSDADRLAAAASEGSARLERIDGAGHTFGAVHPFAGTTEHLERILELSADWFIERMG